FAGNLGFTTIACCTTAMPATGSKSWIGSKPVDLYRLGFTACALLTVTSHTLPSLGADLATHAEPMFPPAPGRFSTTALEPVNGGNRAATARAITSLDPPAACGTSRMSVFGRLLPWPRAGRLSAR